MKKFFCMNCMRLRPAEEKTCPICGCVHGQEALPQDALPVQTILNGKYLTGTVRQQSDSGFLYAALDLSNDTPVSILEYFPKKDAGRNGSNLVWIPGPNQVMEQFRAFQTANAAASQMFVQNETVYAVLPFQPVPAKTAKIQKTQKKPSKKAGRTAGICAALAAVLVLGWCGVQHFRGNSFRKDALYDKAISAYRSDFLFSGSSRRETLREAGEAAFADGDYRSAADYFLQLGDDAADRWSDSLYALGTDLIAAKDPDGALEALEEIRTEERAAQQIGVAQLAIAQRMLESGDAAGAVSQAEAIENTDAIDLRSFLNTACLKAGDQCMDRSNYQGAMDYYQKCSEVTEAQTNSDILSTLQKREYYSAACTASDAVTQGATSRTREQWAAAFDDFMGSFDPSAELNSCLEYQAAKAMVREPVDFQDPATRQQFQTIFEAEKYSTMITNSNLDTTYGSPVASLEDVYSRAKGSLGRVLILVQNHKFPTPDATQVICWEAMDLLPADRRAASLEEAEYVMVIGYNYTRNGTYTKGTIATRENCNVDIFRMPGKSRAAGSGTIYGDYPPNSFTYYAVPPVWYSSGAPSVGQAVYDALAKIL